jgi:protein ImuA
MVHPAKADMISRLRGEILQRQGLQKTPGRTDLDIGLGSVCKAFPDHVFPLAAVHEFICASNEGKAASVGFISGLLGRLMKRSGCCLWVAPSHSIFPPALLTFGIDPSRIIFTTFAREKEQLWVMEEALKCDSLSAIVGDIRNLDFTASRRLQLAVEQSKVTGFLIRHTNNVNTTACVSRWRVSSLSSNLPEGMPGIGFPRWKVELLKIRNGKPGSWTLEWRNKKFKEVIDIHAVIHEEQRMIS